MHMQTKTQRSCEDVANSVGGHRDDVIQYINKECRCMFIFNPVLQ